MIPATQPYLPPLAEYQEMTAGIWQRRWLTNQGQLLRRFEEEVGEHLGLPHISVVNSGTTGLLMVLQGLPTGSEVVTTPFSYIATASSVYWQGLTPVFADIEADTLTIDPRAVEAAITKNTSAILATHVFGNPCDAEALEASAAKHDLTLIFDAAHCFGTDYRSRSVLHRGDYSVLSFHATKVFHTVSGGLVASRTADQKAEMDRKRNFGHAGKNTFVNAGINGKMDEFQAAMGILNLKAADVLVSRRREQWFRYRERLGHRFDPMILRDERGFNGAYFPVFMPEGRDVEAIVAQAEVQGIELRRYFYPALNRVDFAHDGNCPIAEGKAETVCCLPLYHDLTEAKQDKVVSFLMQL